MTNQSTIDKLIEMRLSSMADAFRIQMNDSAMKEVPFEDRFGMLVDVEYTNRKNNRLKKLIRQAANSHFPRPAGPHFPASQGHIKRPVLEISRVERVPPC